MYHGLLDMLRTTVLNSHFGKRPIAREMMIFRFHVGRPKCKFLLMFFSFFGFMAISRVVFWFFISAMCMINRTMGILALGDGLFANLLIFDYFRMF